MKTRHKDGLLECSRVCLKHNKPCDNAGCKHWISFEDEHNCVLISVNKNGRMTLREVAIRLKISFSRVKQIEVEALKKIKKRMLSNGIAF